MTNLTTEEIAELKQIAQGAPETAIEVCLYDYGDSEQITYLNCESQFYDDEEEFKWVDMELVDDFFHSRRRLSDIRTIIAQHEEIGRLHEQRNSLAQIVDNALECAFNGCDYYGADIQEHCLNLGVTVSITFDSSIHADYNAALEDGDEYHEWSDWFTEIMRETKWKEQSDER